MAALSIAQRVIDQLATMLYAMGDSNGSICILKRGKPVWNNKAKLKLGFVSLEFYEYDLANGHEKSD